MRKKDNIEINWVLKDFPDDVRKHIIDAIESKDYNKIRNARKALVKMGKSINPLMHQLLESENILLRTEAAKIMELIADKNSINVLIKYLGDKEFEIRWMAAEGLIRIGRKSILPLIKSIRNGKSSFFHNKGVHHVLLVLLNDKEKMKVKGLIRSLDDFRELGETAPIEADKAIKTLYGDKS